MSKQEIKIKLLKSARIDKHLLCLMFQMRLIFFHDCFRQVFVHVSTKFINQIVFFLIFLNTFCCI